MTWTTFDSQVAEMLSVDLPRQEEAPERLPAQLIPTAARVSTKATIPTKSTEAVTIGIP